MNFNIAEAYLTNDNGIITIKSKGKLEDRINNIHILIDNMSVLTIQYNDLNFKYNQRLLNYNYDDEYNLSLMEVSTYNINEVLSDYIEEYTEIVQEKIGWKFWPFIRKYKEVENIKLRVKQGIVRLNKDVIKHSIKTNSPWYIEYNTEAITSIPKLAKEIYTIKN